MTTPSSTPLHIGWAQHDVTPDRPVILRGQFHVRISNQVRDPLLVTALALAAGDQQCVLVSADRVSMPELLLNGVRARLPQLAPDLDPLNVFINATHTHTAPEVLDDLWENQSPEVMTPGEYAAAFIERTAECVAAAWQAREPGGVSWGCGHAVVGFNRRQVKLDGSSRMYGDTGTDDFSHIEGYDDHGVDMLFTYDAQAALTGMVLNLACPAQATESAHFVSADFWHEARTEIRQCHGHSLFVLPQCSAAGDQSPHRLWKKQAEARMLQLKGLHDGQSDVRLAERVDLGRRIAAAVDEVIPLAARDIRRELPMQHVVRTLNLPRRLITPEDVAEARQEIQGYENQLAGLQDRPTSDPERSRAFGRRRWYRGVLERYELQQSEPTYPMELHVLRLGDVVFATNSFELYLDYGLRMKVRSPALQTFVVQLTGPGTYLPSRRSMGGGSYGSVAASNTVGPDGGDVLVDETVSTIRQLFA